MAQKKTNAEAESVQVETVTEHAFTRNQLVNCAKYAGRKDLLNTILKDGQVYTFSQVDKMIQDFDSGDYSENKERNGDE